MGYHGALRALGGRDVQRICSGQSVVDLATAVKELVENALDAGASQVEVRLKELGRDAVEVSDNGAGVSPADFGALARKHCTSKISRFEDIERVASFGFRWAHASALGYFSLATWLTWLSLLPLRPKRRGAEFHLRDLGQLLGLHTHR